MNFNWPIEDNWNHCNVKSVGASDIEPFWSDLHRAINGIHWDELIELHNHEHNHRMSMSTAISERLDYEAIGATSDAPIFSKKLVHTREDRGKSWANCD